MKAKLRFFEAGASRFDFAVSVCIFALLVSVLLGSLNRIQSQAEAVAMEADLANLRWELREFWAHRNATGQSLSFDEIDNANPMRLLNERPKNYSGEYSKLPVGVQSVWYFNTQRRRLVYVFSDGRQVSYRLTGTAGLNRASRGMMGGMDLVQD